MRIKSYFADSVQEAIEKARVELGPEAMLMNSKKTDFELRSLGTYEVIFGVAVENFAPKPVANRGEQIGAGSNQKSGPVIDSSNKREKATFADSVPEAAPSSVSPISGDLTRELADLRRQIETVKRSVTRQQRATTTVPGVEHHPGAADLAARLMASDFSEDLAQEIAEAAELRAFAARQPGTRSMRDFEMLPSEMLELALQAELDRRVQTSPELGCPGDAVRVVMLAGPAGAGKTTALIKLALRYGLSAGVPMHLFSLDTLRVGGWEQLASYARIAGIGFDAVHNWNTFNQVLSLQGNKRLIFVDTPGLGPAEGKELAALKSCCVQHGSIDIHLVCPATLRASAGMRLIERFRTLGPAKLLLTHTDDVSSPGGLLELAIRSGLPLSYLSNGQNIPEDIVEASRYKLLSAFASRPKPAVATAA